MSNFWNKLGNFLGNVIPGKNSNPDSSTWNHNNGYNVDSTGETASQLSGSGIDPFGLVSGLYNDVMGISSQQREFSQQEYLQDKQNEYNLPANQMVRMKAAGINPLTAAGQIAQGGNESAQAPQVASNTQGGSQGLGALAGVAGAVTGGIGDIAGAVLAGSQANEINSLLGLKRAQLAANTAHELAGAGYENSLADYWGTKAAYASIQESLDVLGKVYSIKHVKKDLRRLDDEHNISLQDLDIRKQQLAQEEYRTQMMAIDKYFQDERKRIYESVGVDTTKSENQMLIEAEANGTIDTVVGAFRKNAYEIADAGHRANMETLRERTRLEQEEILRHKIRELATNARFNAILQDLGVNLEAKSAIIRFLSRELFGTGVSISSPVGGISIQ